VIESEKVKKASASKKSSMEALLKNPENKKLLKNKK
jgi:pantoate kinase